MKLLTNAPRGTQDLLPDVTEDWRKIEELALRTAKKYGFCEIRIPTMEHTELFRRSVGDSTDVVQKKMFTFVDRGGRSLSLRPEGTAGTVRAALAGGLLNGALPSKLCYLLTCFRNERPQAGRLKEFHQFGAELFGSSSPMADAELIEMASAFFDAMDIKGLTLIINSIGCQNCRERYRKALISYFCDRKEQLCALCQERLEQNPLRLLDCKNPECQELTKGAPVILDYLCKSCQEHFAGVQDTLQAAGISYQVNPRVVRGLDYYDRTVFEFLSNDLGAQSALCGGGRYDTLVEKMGGSPTPALGFAVGLERLLLVLKAQHSPLLGLKEHPDLFLLPLGQKERKAAFALAAKLRKAGVCVETDLMERSLKAQLKYSDKQGAKYVCILGEDELQSGILTVKRMEDGKQQQYPIDRLIDEWISEIGINQKTEGLNIE